MLNHRASGVEELPLEHALEIPAIGGRGFWSLSCGPICAPATSGAEYGKGVDEEGWGRERVRFCEDLGCLDVLGVVWARAPLPEDASRIGGVKEPIVSSRDSRAV